MQYDPRLVQTHSSDESHDSQPESQPPADEGSSVSGVIQPPKATPVSKPKPRLAGRHIVNDIGHGRNNRKAGVYDPGAVAGGKEEHRLIEAFVELLSASERLEGASVKVTHDMPLTARKALPSSDATSFHLNAAVSKKASGVEVWIPMLASRASAAKSRAIGKAVADVLDLTYRGTKRTTKLGVLNRGFDRLLECAFITNDTDRKRFIDRANLVVRAIIDNL